ncbi:MAG: site-specific DNA-methyltransferase [Psychroserpens sp.]|nr:site-specific DNA-methyltransferase [Psychroserpens sp.]
MYRSKIELHNVDCLLFMKQCEDKQFDLAIVDPPYGLGIDGNKEQRWPDGSIKRKAHEIKGWDEAIPNKEYFDELKRISKNQIVWGANYFTEFLEPTKAWVFWYKGQQGLTMSDGEMAWTSLKKVTRMVNIHRTHIWQEKPMHPTQKPVKLYKWLLKNYAEEGQTIFDSHLGSGSIAIACDELGFDLTACEIDKDYFDKANKRLKPYRNQQALF